MKSALQIHKEAVRFVEQRILDKQGAFRRSNFGKVDEPVGSFAVFQGLEVQGTALMPDLPPLITLYDTIPIQTMHQNKRGELVSGDNYRLARYGIRLAVDVENGVVELHEMQDHPDIAGNEWWVPIYRI